MRGTTSQPTSRSLQGIAVSPGIQIKKIKIYDPDRPSVSMRRVTQHEVKAEERDLKVAIKQAREDITELREKIRQTLDDAHASIFDPQIMMLEDPMLIQQAIDRIEQHQENAAMAFMTVIRMFTDQFAATVADGYISSRRADILDVGNRVVRILGERAGNQDDSVHLIFDEDVIVLAPDLSPSDTAQMDHTHVLGFATELGGPTSHTAILAKALEIPAVVGLGQFIQDVQSNTLVIIDGYEGTLTINPTSREIARARARRRRRLAEERNLLKLKDLPAETIDGYRLELSANIELPIEIPHVIAHGGEGIGLYRTEFQYIEKESLPTEEDLFDIYKHVVEQIAPHPVIFRTIDLGGDKLYHQLQTGRELNPFLGLRAIRLCLAYPSVFRVQLRAILRASHHGRVRVMFPLISNVREVHQAKQILEEVKQELRQEKTPFDEQLPVGCMIEIPSAAICSDQLAKEVDFFSIGSNDLIQYTLAVDRSNEQVASLYDPFNPAILRLIRTTIDNAQREGIWVGVCGEMCTDPMCALLLIGLGVNELSMGALAIPEIKRLIRQITFAEARTVAEEVYSLRTSAEIHEYVRQYYRVLKRRKRIQSASPRSGA